MTTTTRILVCILLVCMMSVSFMSCSGPSKESDTHVPVFYEYLIPLTEEQTVAITSQNLTLANKQSPLSSSYTVELADLPKSAIINHDSIQVEKTMSVALLAMIAEMRHDGISDTFVTSGYRSFEYQSSLFNHYCNVERDKHPSWTQAQVEEEVLTYSARPGTSEHQTGLCVDFMTQTMSDLDNSFERTRAFEWLTENAHRFGFIIRYPSDKQDVTGYAYESWHYRFVGRDAATVISHQHITLEEYLQA